MVDITITPANVVPGSNAKIARGTAGVALTAGQVVYLDSATTGKYQLADTDSATAAVRSPHGIALHAASANQPISVQTEGALTIGATLVAGDAYYLSGTPGGICPVADVAAGDYPCIIGQAASTSVLNVDIVYAGVVKA